MVTKPRQVREFHRALGEALTCWQHVETSLYVVSHCLLETKHELSSMVFFHIESARSKVSLTDKLCRRCLPQHTYARHWKPLKTDVSRAVDFRNAMAHFEPSSIDPAELERLTGQVTDYPIVMSPNAHDASFDGNVKALFVETLHKITVELHRLARGLAEFVPSHIPDWQRRSESLPPATRRLLETIRNG